MRIRLLGGLDVEGWHSSDVGSRKARDLRPRHRRAFSWWLWEWVQRSPRVQH